MPRYALEKYSRKTIKLKQKVGFTLVTDKIKYEVVSVIFSHICYQPLSPSAQISA